MPDQEVHEIQLNGKQLVFMFMAATVVSVVIFLCGVMVGRGAHEPQAELLAASAGSTVDPTAPIDPIASRSAPPVDTTSAPAPGNLTYAEHLEAPVAPNEPLKPSKPKPAEPKPAAAPAIAQAAPAKPPAPKAFAAQDSKDAVRQTPAPAPQKPSAAKPEPGAKAAPAAESAGLTEPAGKGFVVQVMAFPERSDAAALARRLAAKGYPTFVTLNEGAARARYRVRVGKFPTKSDADAIALRLRQEERFEPWVTR